jgi:anti-sigma regulatory factor (Ser/Thr protein kinase)
MSLVRTDRRRDSSFASSEGDRPYVRESYPAIAGSVRAAREAIVRCAAAAGADEEQLEAIRLACSEALTNVVLYAYRSRTGQIYVTARVAGDELWVLISDNGSGIHAGVESQGLGLGLALITQLTDGFSVVQRSTGGTELQLGFVLTGRRDGAGAERRDGARA